MGQSKLANLTPEQVILKAVFTDKSHQMRMTGGRDLILEDDDTLAPKVVFEVNPKSTKPQIRAAVEKLFDVKVTKVNTLIQRGKKKIRRASVRNWYPIRTAQKKKAIVTLAPGESIEFFDGV